jgi:hypothetical protein
VGTGSALAVNAATTTTYFARASSASQGTLMTPMTGGVNSYNGNMFDVFALSDLVVTGIDLHLPSLAVHTVEIWYRTGSFAGYTSSSAGWTQAGSATVTGNGSGTITAIPVTFSAAIAPGQTCGFYVTASSNLNSSPSGPVGTIWVSNNDMQLLSGNAGAYFAVNTPDVGLNGFIRYFKPGCTSPMIAVTLTVQPNPTVSATVNPTLICQGDSALLVATGAASYSWSAGGGNTVYAHPSVSTSYSVTGYDPLGCADTANVMLQVLPSPTLVTSPAIPSLCAQSSITLSVTGANQYTWSTGANIGSIVLTPPGNTLISVTGAGSNSCVTTVTLAVTVYSIPVISASDTLVSACENQQVKLSASGGVSYNWNPGNFNTDTLIIIANGTTNYTVTGFDGHCRNTAIVIVQAEPCTGIPEETPGGFWIFPNPSTGNLMLMFNTEAERTIRIYDLTGTIIEELTTSAQHCAYSLGSVANGLYQLTVIQNGKSVSRKILLVRE